MVKIVKLIDWFLVMSKFKINFYWDDQKSCELEYVLYNNPVVNDFIKTVKQGSDIPVYNTSMTFTKSETVDAWCELYKIAKRIASTDIYDKTIGRLDPDIILNGWNQDTLNYLHNYVEEYEVILLSVGLDDLTNRWLGPDVSRFNDIIHNMENNQVGYNSSWLSFRMEPFLKIPLREEHMPYMEPGYRNRKLYLGYSEIGKTLFHMYRADDVQAAERLQSNPKAHITNEIFIPYFNDNFDEQGYNNWCISHAQGVDHRDPRQYKNFEIGELVDVSKDVIKRFNRIEVELIDV